MIFMSTRRERSAKHKNRREGYHPKRRYGGKKISPQAQETVSEYIAQEREAGHPPKQATAIGISRARRDGYHIPKRKLRRIS